MSDAFSKGISGRAVALGLLCCIEIAFDEPYAVMCHDDRRLCRFPPWDFTIKLVPLAARFFYFATPENNYYTEKTLALLKTTTLGLKTTPYRKALSA